jgi:hypothetical protein
MTSLLAGKASTAHTHTFASITAKPVSFEGSASDVTNRTLTGAGTTSFCSFALGPLVSGQKYMVGFAGQVVAEGDLSETGDLTLTVSVGATTIGNPESTRFEQGVDGQYTINDQLIVTGTGGTSTVTLKGIWAGGSLTTRFAKIAAFAMPVN